MSSVGVGALEWPENFLADAVSLVDPPERYPLPSVPPAEPLVHNLVDILGRAFKTLSMQSGATKENHAISGAEVVRLQQSRLLSGDD